MSWYPDPSQPPKGPNPYYPPQEQAPGVSNPYEQPSPSVPPYHPPYGTPAEYIPPSPTFYEHPMGYGFAPPLPGPRPLGQAIQELPRQYLKVLTKPGAQAFTEEQGKADWGIIWLQLLFIGLIGTVIGVLHTVLSMGAMYFSTENAAALNTLYSLTTSGPSIFSVVSVVAGFFIVVSIQYLLAKAFGGNGDFKQQGYSYLLFYVPLTLVSNVLGLVPVVGLIFGFGAAIYQIVLNVFSIMAAHRLNGGKATAVVLIPVVALIVLALVCAFILFIVLASLFSHRVI